jgi:hypothetical protein
MSSLKVTYFNAAGRAELTRLLFKIGGIAFEDERLSGVRIVALPSHGQALSFTILLCWFFVAARCPGGIR